MKDRIFTEERLQAELEEVLACWQRWHAASRPAVEALRAGAELEERREPRTATN